MSFFYLFDWKANKKSMNQEIYNRFSMIECIDIFFSNFSREARIINYFSGKCNILDKHEMYFWFLLSHIRSQVVF